MLGTYYIILRKSGTDRYVFAIETTKIAADVYPASDFEYVHWVVDCCGALPKIDSLNIWADTRAADLKRRSGYICESDECYTRYRGQIEDGVADATAKQTWINARNTIRTKYPH